jgi:hypothetical protein
MQIDVIQEAPPTGGWGYYRPAYRGEPLWTAMAAAREQLAVAVTTGPIKLSTPLAIAELNTLAIMDDAPSAETLRATKALYYLARAVTEPEVHHAPDGEVSLVWRKGARYLELGVDADGAVSYYGRASGRAPLLGDLDAVPDSLPESLVAFLGGFGHGVRVRRDSAERV